MKPDNSAQNTQQSLTATLNWDEQGLPVSSHFDDVYFSKVSGIAETRYVFLHHNQLKQRFEKLEENQIFTIAETGFGTGLNFLCAWQLFDKIAPGSSQLHFISTEKFPLDTYDMRRALSIFPELEPWSSELRKQYKLPQQQKTTLSFASGRIKLTLWIGDVLDSLPNIDESVDAWFLDGFAPAKNPEMWQPSLFKAMAIKSANEATYATFTVASIVRNGLTSAGFTINRRPGFGAKREMICGQFSPDAKYLAETSPWFAPGFKKNANKTAVVIGGGMAGTSCARSLAERGWKVTLLEQHNQLAEEASGNPQAILYAKLSADQTPLSQFILAGYRYTLGQLEKLQLREWNPCGVIQLVTSEKNRTRFQQLDQQHSDDILKYLPAEQLSEFAGIPVSSDGLFFPQAGWIDPRAFCEALADHKHINVQSGIQITELKKTSTGWQLISDLQRIAEAETVVIAGGTNTRQFEQLSYLPLKAVRGQITKVTATAESEKLRSCVCSEGYIAPASNGYHTMGATFSLKDSNPAILEKDHRKNIGLQAHWYPEMYSAMGGKSLEIAGGRVGFRNTTPDYLPMIGGIVDYPQFVEQFAPLRKNLKYRFSDHAQYLDGLFVSAGHGSRGTVSCPLAGEILAAMINGEPVPVDPELLEHLNPTRFIVRDLAKNRI